MTAAAFLDQINWFHSLERLPEMEEDFIRQMISGLNGQDSSLAMIPTYLKTGDLPEESRKVIVLDAGGTNLRTFLVSVHPGEDAQVLYSHKCPMPGRLAPLSREDFFDAIAKEVAPIVDQADCIGFCFSFPCVIQPDYDGKILYMDKEIIVHDIEGAMVGSELKQALKKLGCACTQQLVVLNDTVAALLGSLAVHPASCYSGYIGVILGTGTNCCYLEKNSAILKNEFLRNKPGYSIINMESGSYHGRFPLSKADLLLGQRSAEANSNLSEKMVSGAYQGMLLKAMLDCAAEAGLFSEEFSSRLKALSQPVETKDISAFTDTPAKAGVLHDLCTTDEDLHTLLELSDALLDRAALLTVMNLVAIMRHTGCGQDPTYPVAIAIEGTTFEREEQFRKKIESYLISYAEKQCGLHCRIFRTPDANMVGAAIAALLAE